MNWTIWFKEGQMNTKQNLKNYDIRETHLPGCVLFEKVDEEKVVIIPIDNILFIESFEN